MELRTVQPESAELYKQSLRKFTKWATVNGRRLVEDDEVDDEVNDEVDDAVVGYMNERIFAGGRRRQSFQKQSARPRPEGEDGGAIGDAGAHFHSGRQWRASSLGRVTGS